MPLVEDFGCLELCLYGIRIGVYPSRERIYIFVMCYDERLLSSAIYMFSALNHSSTSSFVWLNEMTLRLEEMEVRMKNDR